MRKIFIIVLVMLITGCASQMPSLVKGLNAETPCCKSYSEFSYKSITTENEHKFEIGSGDNVFLFPSGKSYFKAFELPNNIESYSMEIRTYLVGEWIPTAHVFGPFIKFLDAEYSVLKEGIFPELFYDEGFIEGARWTGVVQIPKNSKYAVLFTKPELVNTRISLGSTEGYAYSTGTSFVYVPPSGERSSSYGPAGNVRVRFIEKVR